jgi:hypothetical protein
MKLDCEAAKKYQFSN